MNLKARLTGPNLNGAKISLILGWRLPTTRKEAGNLSPVLVLKLELVQKIQVLDLGPVPKNHGEVAAEK
jgi:hypothetical protein